MTESVAVTVTRPVKPAGRVTVAPAAGAGIGGFGATVTPADMGGPSTTDCTVRPPGSAFRVTTEVRTPTGSRAGAAAMPRSRTATTGTFAVTWRLGWIESVPFTRAV